MLLRAVVYVVMFDQTATVVLESPSPVQEDVVIEDVVSVVTVDSGEIHIQVKNEPELEVFGWDYKIRDVYTPEYRDIGMNCDEEGGVMCPNCGDAPMRAGGRAHMWQCPECGNEEFHN